MTSVGDQTPPVCAFTGKLQERRHWWFRQRERKDCRRIFRSNERGSKYGLIPPPPPPHFPTPLAPRRVRDLPGLCLLRSFFMTPFQHYIDAPFVSRSSADPRSLPPVALVLQDHSSSLLSSPPSCPPSTLPLKDVFMLHGSLVGSCHWIVSARRRCPFVLFPYDPSPSSTLTVVWVRTTGCIDRTENPTEKDWLVQDRLGWR